MEFFDEDDEENELVEEEDERVKSDEWMMAAAMAAPASLNLLVSSKLLKSKLFIRAVELNDGWWVDADKPLFPLSVL